MPLNVNLGRPYEAIIDSLIKKGYASTKTEAIKYALNHVKNDLEVEEVALLNRAIAKEIAEVESGKQKTYSFKEVFDELDDEE
jgi:Arc/MetJ-type ribon-helix-helix transcriptional regulator